MRDSNRVTVLRLGSMLICLALPSLLAAAEPTVRPAAETARPDAISGQDMQQDLEQHAQLEAQRREQERLQELEAPMQLVVEYIVVGFEPNEQFEHAGNCPLPADVGDKLRATDISVMIEGECQGKVGETIQMTLGSFEISVDVAAAKMQVVDIEDTAAHQPMLVTISIGPEMPSAPSIPEIIE